MSKTTTTQPESSLASIEPGNDAAGKSLRVDPKSEQGGGGGGGVFRLDSLAPGAAESGKDAFAAPKSRVSQSALFFLALIVVGGVILFFMRQIGIGPMASFATIKAPDYDVTKDLKGKTGDHKRVLKDLSESSVKTQVPIEQVQKNPFKLAEMSNAPPDPTDDAEEATRREADRIKRDREARRKQADGVLATLKVRAILGSGPTSVAQINDDAVRIGDTIQDLFTVKAMRDRDVDLETEDGQVYTISLDDGSGAKSKSKPGSNRK